MVTIGKTQTEKSVHDSIICREITREILDFGISQEQILRVMYLLSLELEEHDAMIDISHKIREYLPFLQEKEKEKTEIILK